MKLRQLIRALEAYHVLGPTGGEVTGLSYDSRDLEPGNLFFAWKGSRFDGHSFADRAYEKGASGVVGEILPEGLRLHPGVPFVHVPSTRSALSVMAGAWYHHPSRSLKVAGVTGTNGKTTTCYFLHSFLEMSGFRTGLLGTVEYRVAGLQLVATRTTPEGLELQHFLARMRDSGSTHAVVELSSHSLAQGRADGIRFDVGIFTNLSPEHLDFHASMEEYFLDKCLLLRLLKRPSSYFVVNWDDPYGRRIPKFLPPHVRLIRCGIQGKEALDLEASQVKLSLSGTEFWVRWRKYPRQKVRLPHLGEHNVRNFLCALAAAWALGISWKELTTLWEGLPQVPGRMERFSSRRGFTVVVDYAHTEEGLRYLLQTLRALGPRKLSLVVGCGGNRDRTKRPRMAQVAVEGSDRVYFTADNPRDEPLEKIFADMQQGVPPHAGKKVHWIADRKEAIGLAIADAREGDIVCVAGKGHERTQEIAGQFLPFDDREVVRWLLSRESR
ncbi:UDP-N-acetylmuramoyl-L-alanyl-D-glutamate--2,6-diaminopimelate ligase [Candidatus Methylacidithermus pantelleriae]|uniref:UDP-N-acetylmuramoyl-L-alanyl-D-glutamate--2,6-diaminopimelate ligase n=1 Tax=Candidatus Methylacidithermus pantelleriae TaxID=2744239 RepID=A0A8J2BHI5_9BACT|nr:UDP-N-acetylmuramoyl-L-alanyl-D-glutamate--2,6-diaminopimelate ligase [Candidatus Methylacidithermus pantelleriae]CAF0694970.1 UDP-N-acetylmuramoyl-L-alanyl-D-glutamate--2, 6-diaminopimelate ligase [Candidatus Methylacidithermus pantelleriae]